MTASLFDKLNLRPNERRLVIIVAIVVFIIINAIFVWPHFSDWSKIRRREADATEQLRRYRLEVDNTPRYQRTMSELEKAGASVASEDQALKLANTVQNQALLSGVQWNGYQPGRPTAASTKPNQFFEEQTGILSFVADEKSLIDFLHNLGTGGSLIRVRTMTLNPDAQRYKLQGSLTLVASYAKKTPPKVTAPTARTATKARSTNTT
ncbi:MAG TPA: hypothetical protein VK846_01750, partial [Candidatus Limnocylindria bacterium]|nr:hypothetical protein [Candidatus Limnocylindria bacterium]